MHIRFGKTHSFMCTCARRDWHGDWDRQSRLKLHPCIFWEIDLSNLSKKIGASRPPTHATTRCPHLPARLCPVHDSEACHILPSLQGSSYWKCHCLFWFVPRTVCMCNVRHLHSPLFMPPPPTPPWGCMHYFSWLCMNYPLHSGLIRSTWVIKRKPSMKV